MNNIYEYKANKYKLKYLKLKQLKNNNQLEGGLLLVTLNLIFLYKFI
jgi:hypothetical protein